MLSTAHSSAELLVAVPLKLTVHEVTSVPLNQIGKCNRLQFVTFSGSCLRLVFVSTTLRLIKSISNSHIKLGLTFQVSFSHLCGASC